MEDKYWIDKSRKKHFIPEMETEYLLNIVRNITQISESMKEKNKMNVLEWLECSTIKLTSKSTAEEIARKQELEIKLYKEMEIEHLINLNSSFNRKYYNVIAELKKRMNEKIKNNEIEKYKQK
jgi:hypothetical protein